jgi:glycosyltransferase involved in cell wall biosynthesis
LSAESVPPEARRVLLMSERADFFGGGQHSLLDLARVLRGTRFAPLVLLPSPGPLQTALRTAAIETRVLPLPPPGVARIVASPRAIGALAGLVRRDGVAILHSDAPRSAFYAGMAARLTRRAHLWHLRASVTRSPLVDRLLLALTDRVVAVSHAAATRSAPLARFRGREIVPTGIPVAAHLDPRAARLALGLPPDRLVVGVIGRVEPDKGGDDAIAAFASVHAAHPDAILAFLGSAERQDRWLATLLAAAADAGLGNAVRFLGDRPEAAPLLPAFDLILHPSRHEALPRVLIEALQSGVPAVAYAVGGVPEVIEDGRTGVLVAPGDARALAAAVTALASQPLRRTLLGRAGTERAREHFSIEAMGRDLVRIYSGIIGDTPDTAHEAAA